jgi:hypothetical protein
MTPTLSRSSSRMPRARSCTVDAEESRETGWRLRAGAGQVETSAASGWSAGGMRKKSHKKLTDGTHGRIKAHVDIFTGVEC